MADEQLTQAEIDQVFVEGFLASPPTPTPEVDSEIQRLMDKADADEAFILSQVHNSDDPSVVNNDGSIGEPWPDGPKPADLKVEEVAEALIKGSADVLVPTVEAEPELPFTEGRDVADIAPTDDPVPGSSEKAVEDDQSEDPK